MNLLDDRLSVCEMQVIQGGKWQDLATCGGATGLMCTAAVLFALSPAFCLAPGYAIGCGLGLATC